MNDILGTQLKSIEDLDALGLELPSTKHPIKNNLRELLTKRGISQSDLSILTGIGRQNISDIVQLRAKPGVDFALKIASVLSVQVEDVFELEPHAWNHIAKVKGDTILLDLYTLRIISSRTKLDESEAPECGYIDLESRIPLTEAERDAEFEEFESKKLAEAKQKHLKLSKREIKAEFEETVVARRFQKLIERVVPYSV